MSNNSADQQKSNTSQKKEEPSKPPKPPKREPIKFEKTVHLKNDGAGS
ncbi:hypothetical protein [Tychonema sp. BBK16]|nr:hypothetical protein [Tychonema sp. BBK16]MCF6373685.1 hypothetical protein [Tychonema sp. BBK16]